jgi:hypothetical protein
MFGEVMSMNDEEIYVNIFDGHGNFLAQVMLQNEKDKFKKLKLSKGRYLAVDINNKNEASINVDETLKCFPDIEVAIDMFKKND